MKVYGKKEISIKYLFYLVLNCIYYVLYDSLVFLLIYLEQKQLHLYNNIKVFKVSYRADWRFLGSSAGKESICNVWDLGQSLGWEDPLEEGIATHSSILAWRIPMDRGAWQLQSQRLDTGSQRVGHDWVTQHSIGQINVLLIIIML